MLSKYTKSFRKCLFYRLSCLIWNIINQMSWISSCYTPINNSTGTSADNINTVLRCKLGLFATAARNNARDEWRLNLGWWFWLDSLYSTMHYELAFVSICLTDRNSLYVSANISQYDPSNLKSSIPCSTSKDSQLPRLWSCKSEAVKSWR